MRHPDGLLHGARRRHWLRCPAGAGGGWADLSPGLRWARAGGWSGVEGQHGFVQPGRIRRLGRCVTPARPRHAFAACHALASGDPSCLQDDSVPLTLQPTLSSSDLNGLQPMRPTPTSTLPRRREPRRRRSLEHERQVVPDPTETLLFRSGGGGALDSASSGPLVADFRIVASASVCSDQSWEALPCSDIDSRVPGGEGRRTALDQVELR